MSGNKTTLVLMEQMIMIVVFALAAALCLQAFVKSDALSQSSAQRDQAVLLVQSAAERIQAEGASGAQPEEAISSAAEAMGGTCLQGRMSVGFDRNWNTVEAGSDSCAYLLCAQREDSYVDGLRKAAVWVESCTQKGETIFEVQTAWQEVDLND